MGDSKEMPLWQQHLIQKQLQEIQMKNQIQQLERGIRQQNMLCQVASPRQRAQPQLPLFKGMAINNQSSFMLQNDNVHAEPKAANTSNIMSNNHGQAKHLPATRFAPQQQSDQLLHGTPVSSGRGLMGHYTQLQGIARNYADAIDKASHHSLAHQNIQAPDFHNLDALTGWSNNLEQNGVGPSEAVNGLDPEEEKILFGTNDGGNLGVLLNDDSFKNTDSFDAFPSLNSGSWSALMQDAVQSSSSDKGFREEWSGLSFQNPESSITKYEVTLDNNSNNSNNTSVRPLPVSGELSVKQMFYGITEEQIQPNDASYDVWPRNMHDQSNKSSQDNLNVQESVSLSNRSDLPDGKFTLFPQNGGNMSSAMNQLQFNQTQSISMYGNNSNSSEEIDQRALSRYHYDQGKIAFSSSTKPRSENVEEYKHQRNNIHQIQESSMNSAEQSSPSMSDSWTTSGMSGWKPAGPQIFQLPKDTNNSTTFPMSVFRKSQEQGYVANSQLKKGYANSLEEVQHRRSMSRHPSQNMQELLQSVDKSIISVPPSQIQPVSNHDLQSHASFLYSNSQQLNSTGFGQSSHHPNEALQKEHLEVKSFSSGQQHIDISQILSEGNSSANSASNLSYMGRQSQMWKQQQLLKQQLLHHQRLSNASKHDIHASQSLLRQIQNFQNMAITNQSSQIPLPNVAGRILPFNLDPPFHLTSIHNLKAVQAQQINSPDVLPNIWANTSSRGSNELGTCSQDSPTFVEGDQIPAEEVSMNGFESETCSTLQDQEKTSNSYSNMNSIKHSNLPSIVQQPKFSLLKQMQAYKASNTPSSNTKMLSLSSGENEEKIAVETVHDIQIQSQHPSSTSQFVGKSEQSLRTPQRTQSLFEQHRKYTNGQFVAMSQNMIVNINAANELSNSSPQLQLGVDNDLFERSNKRKIDRTELESWHQVVSLGVQRLQNISMAENGWAQATNRLIDKMEDAIELIEDGSLVHRARRRLTLTTILMQKLLPPIPAPILAVKATSAYESVTYFIAKEALGDACSLIYCSQSDCGQDQENKVTEKHRTSKKLNDLFLNVVEEFSGRLEKLENAFSRLDKRTSFLETKLDWQEVERITLINRLGKIHARNQKADVADNSSTSHNARHRGIQRFVTGFSTAYVPHGVQCLSL